MASKKIPIDIDINTREASRAVKELNTELGKSETGLEDVGSAGKLMARVIEAEADGIIAELEETRRAVDALERALGPDFDADTTAIVADLKKVGLTADDIEADVDQLAAALRRAGDVKIRAQELGFNDIDQALGRTTDNSRTTSTAIGGIGNSISELPGIGSLGPVAESMGMLAENALEGEANLKGLAAAAGGLVVMGLVLKQVQGTMQRIAENKAWQREQVEGYTEALKETDSTVEAVRQKLEQAGELTVSIGQGLFDIDFLPLLAKAGVGLQEFSTLVAGGAGAVDAYKAKMEAAGVPTEQYSAVVAAATQEIGFLKEGQEAAAVSAKFFGEETKVSATHTGDMGRAAFAAARDVRETDAAMDAASLTAARARAEVNSLERAFDALRAEISDRESYLTAAEGFAEVTKAAQATYTTAEEGARANERAVLDLKTKVIEYGDELVGLPPERTTDILALIDQGKLTEAEAALAELERDRTVRLTVALNNASGLTLSGINGAMSRIPKTHGGGLVVGGGVQPFDGMKPDEVASILQKGEAVLTPEQQGAMLGARAGAPAGGATINLTVNAGMGADGPQLGRKIVDVLEAFYRNGGQPPRSNR